MIKEKKNIRSLSLKELKDFFDKKNEKSFRAKQVYEWLWKKSARSFDEMTNLSKEIRILLNENFTIDAININTEQQSKDGTKKISFKLFDGYIIEGVLIPSKNRITACISSQVGCSLGCKFCATGNLGFTRNLYFDEIYDQVAILSKQARKYFNTTLSNIVFMGMGEPLLNYENILKSIDIITSTEGLGISPQRITVSTVGIVKMIRQLGDDKPKFNIALSLHTANNNKRSSIIPVNKQNTVKQLIESLKYYHIKTGKRITIEYVIFKDFNDSLIDAKELADFCKNFPVKINIIEYNPVENSGFLKAENEKLETFVEFLESKNIIINIRKSRGKDIDAACGQLANKLGSLR
ncbi:MAG: 23S rRNA (adenine(2503)-C(2))-methyltransferase RlmN [Bacteroidales bacterium]|nr:23S rRNA (adenine(2503)-C(2))-methyltransferase RlmN [Bacteroidales bacterium]